MKKKLIKLMALSVLGLVPMIANAQLGDVTKILNGGLNDANKIAKAYMNPIGKGFAVNLSNGWYNTAKPHSFPNPTKLNFFLGFDITITTSFLIVPEIDKTYDVSSLGLSSLTPTGTNRIAQTVSGSKTDGPELGFGKLPDGTYMSRFNLPKGFGLSKIPSAMIQGGIGLPFSSEIDFRYLPSMEIPMVDCKIGLWGLGLKHSIKQWIPIISMLPFFDISAQAGYTSFKSSVTGSLFPLSTFSDVNMYNTSTLSESQFNNQGVELNATSFTGNIVVSTDIPIFNIYAGVGFYSSSSTLKITNNYPVPTIPTSAQIAAGQRKVNVGLVSNPINTEFTENGNFRANIGARLKLLVFAINGDVTYAGGSTIYTVGLGINFH
jgi:hypothetical protein